MESSVVADWTAIGFHLQGVKIPISVREAPAGAATALESLGQTD